MQQREADLLAAQSLAREKEAALSQERQRISRERDELQGRLADKVGEGIGARPSCLTAAWGQEPFLALSWLPCSGRSRPGTEGWSRTSLQSPLPSEGLGHLAGVSATPLSPPPSRSLRSRGYSRGCWTSSSRCSGLLPRRLNASCRTRWASWTTPCTCAAPAPPVGPPACPLSLPPYTLREVGCVLGPQPRPHP